MIGIALLSVGACEYGWSAPPPTFDHLPTTNFSHKCYRAAGHAHSLHECLELCGPGASPVCQESDLEWWFIESLREASGYGGLVWLGWYMNAGGTPSCVSANVVWPEAWSGQPYLPWPCLLYTSPSPRD